ncbi:NAD(P)-binding protein [Hypoxylon trugodes]|uniref:NAD(P)-binding protein n=1 Tax=Hypoxylon trugodes TaxID=326681 RepID=UPI00219707C2|nr:NAD(P)-binding protein [Hypoxylon trugodes]KAI1385972.1 NAD(P)-binding protein [Hypoxylon trugodes]
MGSFLSKNEFPVDGRTVLITGGSSGLGLGAARQLAEKGANVIIVGRNESKLQKALTHIKEGAQSLDTQRFFYSVADVTKPLECQRVVSESKLWNHGAPPDVVWCCAGSAHPSLFIDTPLDQFQTMLDSNYLSCVYMAHATLNQWLRPASESAQSTAGETIEKKTRDLRPRHLIFTGSFVSFYSFAGFVPYSPSKAAVRALGDALSQEMNLYSSSSTHPAVRVHTVFPATMPTSGLDDENAVKTDLTKALEEGDQILSPEECARRAIAGLESGQELVPTSTIIRLVMASVLGGSVRGGFWTGLVNTVLGWITAVVMIFIRWDMDSKVAKWGREHGFSGMKKKD